MLTNTVAYFCLGSAPRAAFTFRHNRFSLKIMQRGGVYRASPKLSKRQQAAREEAIRLFFLDGTDFCGSPVRHSGSLPRLSQEIESNTHCGRSVIGAQHFDANTSAHAAHVDNVDSPDAVCFIRGLLSRSAPRSTVTALDNATRERWLIDHQPLLFYLLPCGGLPKIEIVCRHLRTDDNALSPEPRRPSTSNSASYRPGMVPSLNKISREHLG